MCRSRKKWEDMTRERGLKRLAQERASRSKTGDVFCAPRPHENWKGNRRTETRWRQEGGGYKPEIFAPINNIESLTFIFA